MPEPGPHDPDGIKRWVNLFTQQYSSSFLVEEKFKRIFRARSWKSHQIQQIFLQNRKKLRKLGAAAYKVSRLEGAYQIQTITAKAAMSCWRKIHEVFG